MKNQNIVMTNIPIALITVGVSTLLFLSGCSKSPEEQAREEMKKNGELAREEMKKNAEAARKEMEKTSEQVRKQLGH